MSPVGELNDWDLQSTPAPLCATQVTSKFRNKVYTVYTADSCHSAASLVGFSSGPSTERSCTLYGLNLDLNMEDISKII